MGVSFAVMLVPLVIPAGPRLANLDVLGPILGTQNVNEVRPAPGLHLGREQLRAVQLVPHCRYPSPAA